MTSQVNLRKKASSPDVECFPNPGPSSLLGFRLRLVLKSPYQIIHCTSIDEGTQARTGVHDDVWERLNILGT